ncbi:MAG: DNA gyrase inhibitor YacG [Tabrizicola sp.]
MSACPICGKPAVPSYRPFCSRRCADVDLGRWLTEGYRIPAGTEEEAEDAAEDRSPPKPH